MTKTYMGVRLRRLRAERGLSQVALAQALGLSPSYLNQIEQNQRPLTVSVLLKIHRELGVDIQAFSEDETARLVARLRDAFADSAEAITLPELQELAAQMPGVSRALLAMHRRALDATERLEAMTLRVGDDRSGDTVLRAVPFDTVRDFFLEHQNHFEALDRLAEGLAREAGVGVGGGLAEWLMQRLQRRHGVATAFTVDATEHKRRFDPVQRVLQLSGAMVPGALAFQLATQLGLIECGELLDELTDTPSLTGDVASRRLARIGLANYFAAALLMPYEAFLQAAESLRHDIDLLGQRFGVGFETVCQRLSSLQRPDAPGVPFFFVRVDRAGNISKRQSATHFHFSRTGGTCPLWNVYEAFGQPDRIWPQLARMPDDRTYLWIARVVSGGPPGYGAPRKTFSIGLGCDIRFASRLVYAKGLDLQDPEAATPIGMGCKVCERKRCPQRAFPFVGRALGIDEHETRIAPYGAVDG